MLDEFKAKAKKVVEQKKKQIVGTGQFIVLLAGLVASVEIRDYYEQHRYEREKANKNFMDENGNFHENIGPGCYVIWPSYREYKDSKK